ncbi:MAG: hypothetical protein ACXVPX_06410 [Actinomycetota bacterium]
MRRLAASVVVLMLACALPAGAGRAAVASAPMVRLRVFDAAGHRLSYGDVIAISTGGPRGWRSDATYRVSDASIVDMPALVDDGGEAAFPLSQTGIGLTLAWPTAHTGYSTLFVDDGGAGFAAGATVNLTFRAALDYRRKLDEAIARRPAFVPTARFRTLRARAISLIAAAARGPNASTRGALGQQALDALAQTFAALLESDGRQEGASRDPWWGVTVDRRARSQAVIASIAALVDRRPGTAYVRIVFDPGVAPKGYDAIVHDAEKDGIVVVGEVFDSSAMRHATLAAFEARWRAYVDHFSDIHVWEVGNEVNGEWLGTDVTAKIDYAAAYVKHAAPSDTTVLTLLWQMGTAGGPDSTVFQWAHDEISPILAENTDVVALSTWVGGAPLGIAHDEVFQRLHTLFPGNRIAMGELDYWEPGTSRVWSWGSQREPTTAVRAALARHMYLANLAFPYSVGGVFWWFYVTEMSRRQRLWHVVHRVVRRVEAGGGP